MLTTGPNQLRAFQQCFNFFSFLSSGLYFGKFASRVSARAISLARRLTVVRVFIPAPGALKPQSCGSGEREETAVHGRLTEASQPRHDFTLHYKLVQ